MGSLGLEVLAVRHSPFRIPVAVHRTLVHSREPRLDFRESHVGRLGLESGVGFEIDLVVGLGSRIVDVAEDKVVVDREIAAGSMVVEVVGSAELVVRTGRFVSDRPSHSKVRVQVKNRSCIGQKEGNMENIRIIFAPQR